MNKRICSDYELKQRIFSHEVKQYLTSGKRSVYQSKIPALFSSDIIIKFNIITDAFYDIIVDVSSLDKDEFKVYLERFTEVVTGLVNLEHDICYTDHLTGIFNFNYLKSLENELDGKEFNLFFFDLDNMKFLNDKFGHEYGNEVIVQFSKALKQCFRLTDLVFRYGGDEFIVIVFRDDIEIDEVIKRIYQQKEVGKYHISFSVGKHKNMSSSLFETIEQADKRMYERKRMKKDKGVKNEV
ncbi:GGDEF domain-containing protein [Vibrio salinus]|uniref:GGDEF domain-containing protein n=1 Tax=Vibrio salinus TaxID=2899784 RepID=UPI001E3ACFB0|nr:GGDEF domain-containing protein [Vibrio salinus]MCE0495279.1 GGDEF domain-containing protein [Vibrio salinus]